MKQAIVISVKPKWVHKILNGEKDIEVRKTFPCCEYPVDVYIYCTKGNVDKHRLIDFDPFAHVHENSRFHLVDLNSSPTSLSFKPFLNGKVVAKFTLKRIDEIEHTDLVNAFMYRVCQPRFASILNSSCMSVFEMLDYSSVRNLNAWHIEDLVIFDKALGLSDLYRKENKNDLEVDIVSSEGNFVRLSRAPQSWQYVYVGEGKR